MQVLHSLLLHFYILSFAKFFCYKVSTDANIHSSLADDIEMLKMNLKKKDYLASKCNYFLLSGDKIFAYLKKKKTTNIFFRQNKETKAKKTLKPKKKIF